MSSDETKGHPMTDHRPEVREALEFCWRHAKEHLEPWPAWSECGYIQRQGFHCWGCDGEFISERRTGWIKPTDETFPHEPDCGYMKMKAALSAPPIEPVGVREKHDDEKV